MITRLKLYCAVALFLPSVALANDTARIAQSLLNELGYSIAVDGAWGPNSQRALESFYTQNNQVFDGTFDQTELADLTAANNPIAAIMDAETAALFGIHEQNIASEDGLQVVEFEGRTAARFTLRYADGGGREDWNPNDMNGRAQRIQVREIPEYGEMQDGFEYWYKFSMYIPTPFGARGHSNSPWDIKFRDGDVQMYPTFSFVNHWGNLTYQAPEEEVFCWEAEDQNGNTTEMCGNVGLTAVMSYAPQYYDRWDDYVLQVNMREGQEITRIFRNQELLGVLPGDVSRDGDYAGFKFGLYRFRISGEPLDETIYFADVMRRSSCEELGIGSCEAMKSAQSVPGIYGAMEITRCGIEPYENRPCPTLCRGNQCNMLQ